MDKEIVVNGAKYVLASECKAQVFLVKNTKGLEYAVVRTYSAGVFAGFVKSEKGQEAELVNARRIWYWAGAASLSQLAFDGTCKPAECKFSVVSPVVRLKQVIEVLPCTEKAKSSIEAVPVWKQ